jgi:hypothetical protein
MMSPFLNPSIKVERPIWFPKNILTGFVLDDLNAQ